MIKHLVIIAAILFFGGESGVIYIGMGCGIAFQDWVMWRGPIIDAAAPIVRRLAPDAFNIDGDDWCDDAVKLLIGLWRSERKMRQVALVYLWIVPFYWIVIPRIFVSAILGSSYLLRKLEWPVINEVKRIMIERGMLKYVEDETWRKWSARIDTLYGSSRPPNQRT